VDVEIKVTDADANTYSKLFTITITDANDGPTEAVLSNNVVDENVPLGTIIGSFTTTDEDVNDTHTYELQNSFDFDINGVIRSPVVVVGNNLVTDVEIDFEQFSSFKVRILLYN
jgi:hypothetical protein